MPCDARPSEPTPAGHVRETLPATTRHETSPCVPKGSAKRRSPCWLDCASRRQALLLHGVSALRNCLQSGLPEATALLSPLNLPAILGPLAPSRRSRSESGRGPSSASPRVRRPARPGTARHFPPLHGNGKRRCFSHKKSKAREGDSCETRSSALVHSCGLLSHAPLYMQPRRNRD